MTERLNNDNKPGLQVGGVGGLGKVVDVNNLMAPYHHFWMIASPSASKNLYSEFYAI